MIDSTANLFADDFQLLNGGGPLQVGCHQHWSVAVFLQQPSQLAAGRGLTTSLQSTHHQNGDAVTLEGQRMIAGHQVDQSLMHNTDQLLIRPQRLQHIFADGLFRDFLDKVLRNIERDVGFQQCGAHLLHAVADVPFRDLSTSAESRKGVGQTFSNTFEHEISQPGKTTSMSIRARRSASHGSRRNVKHCHQRVY